MKQKLFSMLALLLMAATGAWAQGPWTSGDCTVTLNNGTMTVSGKGAMANYEASSDRPWNDYRNDVTSVVVESGVTTVGNFVFHGFEKMTSVTLPEGLTRIGEIAFTSCKELTSITIPSTVTSIEYDAFYSCKSVTDVNLYADPANLTWNERDCDDFKDDKATKCHVLAEHLSAYQTKFNGEVNVTFVGDLKPLTPTTYSVTLAEGTEDFDKWTIEPKTGLKGGEIVTATYKGEKKVKSVKAVKKGASGTDLATITADYEAKDGETLTGTLASNVKISIADGATVTLKDVNITNLGDNCDWAGINCPGDATLVLAGTNTVCAGRGGDGNNNYPGIWIASGKTLTIQGDGTLTAYSNVTFPYGAGIGGGYNIACGNIVINSGTITATGGLDAAGIGGGQGAGCGNITISGGTVTATGGNHAAGIGGGGDGADYASCGNITISGGTVEATGGKGAAGIGGGRNNGVCGTITITSGVTSVKATKGEGAESIGKGNEGQDITVNIEAGANVTVTLAYPITVTWNNDDINGSGKSFTKDGVTIAANYIYFTDKTFMGGGTFTTSLGNFTKIEVTAKACEVSGSGWSGTTWTGNASSVPFSGDIDDRGAGTIKFVFTIGPAN